jgi:hydroxyethylthiazole kinase-like uncharacterized protein yjeF
MLPVLTALQCKQADAHALVQQGISSLDLMERAALACSRRVLDHLGPEQPVVVICGMGNNGGDGLAMARILHQAGRFVQAVVLHYDHRGSPDRDRQLQLLENQEVAVFNLQQWMDLPVIQPDALVVDAILGTGASRPVEGWLKTVMAAINAWPNEVWAIDLPSGLYAEDNARNDLSAVVRADRTLAIEVPKLSFFLPDTGPLVGQWEAVPIGLDPEQIRRGGALAWCMEPADAAQRMPGRPRFGHKGHFGHAWLLAGSTGRMGAALMAAKACARSGTGLLTVHVPRGMDALVHAALPEALVSLDPDADLPSTLPAFGKVSAVGIGPGIGTGKATAHLLRALIQEAPAPLVLDADALNILAENRAWLDQLPPGSILTPHPLEFDRLTGTSLGPHDRLMKARALAMEKRVTVVLKGACTATCSADGGIFFNTTGNPGMAKGGTGDALTGVLTGLLAQGLAPLDAALLGVHAHGLAGDLAAKDLGMDGMLPNDLIDRLPLAWMELRGMHAPAGAPQNR